GDRVEQDHPHGYADDQNQEDEDRTDRQPPAPRLRCSGFLEPARAEPAHVGSGTGRGHGTPTGISSVMPKAARAVAVPSTGNERMKMRDRSAVGTSSLTVTWTCSSSARTVARSAAYPAATR